MKRKILLYAALFCFAAAVGFWFVPDANPMLYEYAYMGGGQTYEIAKNPVDQITESDGYVALYNINWEVSRVNSASALPLGKAVELELRLDDLEKNVVTDKQRFNPSEWSDDESLDPFTAACWNTAMRLKETRDALYSSEQQAEFSALMEQRYKEHKAVLVPFVPRELTALRTHQINASGLWSLFGLILLVVRKGLLVGWDFRALFGKKMARAAPLSAIFAFALTGNIAVAQQLVNQYKKTDQQTVVDQPLDGTNANPDDLSGRANLALDSAPVDAHLEGWHDGDNRYSQQFASVNLRLMEGLALTGIEQNIQTENGKAATSNFALGFRVRLLRGLSLTLATGPQLEEKGRLAGRFDQLVSYSTVTLHRKLVDIVSFNKFFTTVRYNTAPADRHVLMVRAGPMPNWLYGMWEYKRSEGKTLEDFHGLQVNGKIFGSGDQWWKRILRGSYLYGYYDSIRKDWFTVSGYALDLSFR